MNDACAFTADDESHMRRALALAAEAIGLSDPNPRVGCVIAGDGWTVEGHTQAAGQAHAEVMALRMARERGLPLAGATAYVTLEPCAHHGRTPPCCDALIAAGLGRVVVALGDPHPQVAGEGLRRLRAAGIHVDTGLFADESRALNVGFLSRIERGRPYVRLKIAGSLDGRSALEDGRSQWITGPEARADGHRWRKRAGAVLSGIGTVLADNPRLDVREVPTAHQPLRVIVDARLQTPPTARLLDPPGTALIVAAHDQGPAADALRARGADVQAVPTTQGRIDLRALMSMLGGRGINELHVEAGPALNGALLAAGLVDELLLYQAPLLIGPGRGLAALPPPAQLGDALRFQFIDVTCVGPDLRVRARPIAFQEFPQ
ncbi:bifunctional diaminohydroxyphosphoribosylaminopyrimidine deaminase/5-amino-6-(5-phosphoribosylamino)uracil reductase RibD [Aquabacterium humicola]|uniref:bifunctional diaminohydroxyphosphoribosylaminopyrimidine deaminase/5-amino-6-(5-phosphoribosylamino)uracil reductase RibD n=1 Tax=Aquabacterium humicola TaxID=3237377 RepID=UPI00254397AC|nr:bifunctional diaminohydroxyphosphoribosylaminopyrimidine deaminase/5-amino-6-(5-phosphoribosylamino)uracil reductase RibD [Rubrivivax pictus]